MTFVAPTASQQLHIIVKAAFGYTIADDPGTWVWTDITRYVLPGVTLSAGRSSIAGQADPSQITLTLDNTNGRFTARNPASPYWPNVVRNVPLQVAITWDGAAATYELLTGFVNGWPLTPNAGVLNVSTQITASGRLRRLRRSAQTVASALFRAITIENTTVYDGYWPMEDGAGATQFAHGPTQGTPLANMPVGGVGVPRLMLASSSDTPGSKPLPDFSLGSHVTANVTSINDSVAAGSWNVDHVLFVGDTPSGTGQVLLCRYFYGFGSWRTSLDLTGKNWVLESIDTDGAVTVQDTETWASTVNPFDGQPHMIRLLVHETGPTLTATLKVDNASVCFGALVSAPISNVYKVGVAGTVTSFPLVIGHLVAWNRLIGVDNTQKMLGNPGETAAHRVTRLCGDYGIPVTVVTGTQPAQLMGAEAVDTLANLLDDCADVDNGLLHDAGPSGGLVYTSGAARYNAAVAMTVDYNRLQIGDGLDSTYDDQDLVTEWTVSRNGGSSANYKSTVATDDYASSATVNAATDDQLLNIAGWRTHEGTYDAYRLPSISINMRKTPELAQAATSLVLPFRISPTHLPLPYPQESFDQFAEGFSTTVDSVQWETDYSCQPYGPWQVAVYGTDRYDAAGTILTAAESSTDTAVTVTPPTAGAWTLSTASLPFTVSCDQEQMTVADVANGTSIIAQDGTFELVQASSGWTPTSCTFVDDAAHVHTGAHAAKMIVTGSPAQAFARMAQVSGIVVGDTYGLHGWAFATTGLTNVQITIDWFTGAGVFVSTSNASFTLTANVWNPIRVTATAPATAGKAGVGPTLGGTPATGTTCWFDDFAFTHQVGVNGSTQTLTVVRNAGGVQSTHAIGTPVHIYPLPIYAL